jgi:hypothetical protein
MNPEERERREELPVEANRPASPAPGAEPPAREQAWSSPPDPEEFPLASEQARFDAPAQAQYFIPPAFVSSFPNEGWVAPPPITTTPPPEAGYSPPVVSIPGKPVKSPDTSAWIKLSSEDVRVASLDVDAAALAGELLAWDGESRRPAAICLDARRAVDVAAVGDWLQRFDAILLDETPAPRALGVVAALDGDDELSKLEILSDPRSMAAVVEARDAFYQPRRIVLASPGVAAGLREYALAYGDVTLLAVEPDDRDPLEVYRRLTAEKYARAFTPPPENVTAAALAELADDDPGTAGLSEAERAEWESLMRLHHPPRPGDA